MKAPPRGMSAWPGIIERYREFLPVSAKTPVITLLEGNTPLVPAPRLAEATDPFAPSTERQILTAIGVVVVFLVWRFGDDRGA